MDAENSAENPSNETTPRRPRAWWLYVLGIVAVAAAIVLLRRLVSTQRVGLAQETQARAAAVAAGPHVQVYAVQSSPPERTITLVGEARPFISTTLYAKVSGYLRDIRVDKGDHVEANQVIATIESPETDHQYQAAVADARNKRLNAERAKKLVKRDMIAQQDADQAEADAEVAEANVAALATLKSYETLHAPFTGTVTARYADPGALLQNAASAQTSALPLVTVSQTDKLRIYVYPDQADATFIRPGTPAEITLAERPGFRLAASVTRISGELDLKTRTLLTEIDCANPGDVILPGSFVHVALRLRAPSYLEIPSTALVMRGEKPFVAVVTRDHHIRFRPILIASDDGQVVRVRSGLERGERVALNLGQSVADGQEVQPVTRGAVSP